MPRHSRENVPTARQLRRVPTRTEHLLWQQLRDRRFRGLKFRRQHPVGTLVLDFYCEETRLCIEVDGAVHKTPEVMRRDSDRDAALADLDIRVLRIHDDDITSNLDDVLKRIGDTVDALPPPNPR